MNIEPSVRLVTPQIGLRLTALSVLLAVVPAVLFLVVPISNSADCFAVTSGAPCVGERVLLYEEGAEALVGLAVPVAMAAAALAASMSESSRRPRVLAACALLAFTFLTQASVGDFYIPAAFVMLAAALVRPRRIRSGLAAAG